MYSPPYSLPRRASSDDWRRIVSTRSAVHEAVVNIPLSRFAESVRSIEPAIDLSPGKTSNQVIGITSALPNEGKTTIAASLAQLIAHTGKKVIIVDLPPLAPFVDVRVTSLLIDCYILVVEGGRTKVDVAQHALHTAPSIHENLIGVVLSKTDMKSMLRYGGQRSDYYSDTHYARDGLNDSD